MSIGTCGPRLVAVAGLAGALVALVPSPAAAEDPPGPAFVDELSSQLQPLRDDGPGDPARARPRVRGIRAGVSYEGSDLPPAGLVKRCRLRDATSGLRTWRVRGYEPSRDTHVLRATATDRAGLTTA